MKQIILSLLLAVITATAFAQVGTITVTVVSSEPVTGLTSIDYEFTGIATRTYDLSVEVNFDDAGYQPIPKADLSGDISDVSGNGTDFSGTIVWDGAASFPNHYHELTRIKITATPVFQCGDDVTFTYGDSEVTYGSISKTYNEGASDEYTLCWMDRNLGASQVATSSTDAASYGDLFQWGRFDDGHQVRTNTDHYIGPVSTSVPNDGNDWDGKFITTSLTPYDWLSERDANLWQGGAEDNNPCPPGWRVPKEAEWVDESLSWGSNNNSTGAFASPLKLPVAGNRSRDNGSLVNVSSNGDYWSSTVVDSYSRYRYFNSTGSSMGNSSRASGLSVRCLKDKKTL